MSISANTSMRRVQENQRRSATPDGKKSLGLVSLRVRSACTASDQENESWRKVGPKITTELRNDLPSRQAQNLCNVAFAAGARSTSNASNGIDFITEREKRPAPIERSLPSAMTSDQMIDTAPAQSRWANFRRRPKQLVGYGPSNLLLPPQFRA